MRKNVLALTNVSKKYGNHYVLNNVSLTIEKGDIYGLIGKNGSGKTTIMKLIADLSREFSGGEILLLGARKGTRAYRRSLQRIGTVIDSPALNSQLTAYQEMRRTCIQKGIHDFSIIEEILSVVHLTETGKKKIKHFTVGMKQRLGIAMALVGKPDFLILDEPINGLDSFSIIEFRQILERINRELNTDIIISSHILTELYQIATRFGFLYEGMMIQEISKKDLVSVTTKGILVEVEDVKKAATVLIENQIPHFKVISENNLHIFEEGIQAKEVNKLLMQNGISVNNLKIQNTSLENYFSKLVNQVTNTNENDKFE
ncbi:ABC-2 type transport system ATP-binding protein [Enterococcus sp. AZ194]|uniref:ATP-binding cassette domain-containing protein n=1 Tax=Enterococcus sp. AZ194 TaxID=2774629 RepID=UPI003F1EC09C